jgi:phage protein D
MPQKPDPLVSEFKIQIEGQNAPDDLKQDILHLTVDESLHLPGMFTIVVKNEATQISLEKPWKHEKILAIGRYIEISFYDFATATFVRIIKGEITGLEAHFTEGSQSPIVVRGYDVSHRLHRGRHNRSFQDVTDSDIIKKIAQEVGLKTKIDNSTPAHKYIFQENQTNMEFARSRAARIGFECFVQDDILHFRKPTAGRSISLSWLLQITSFQVRASTAEQVSEVEVRGWDYINKKLVSASQNTGKSITQSNIGQGKQFHSSFHSYPKGPKLIIVDQPCYQQEEAKQLAQALADELSDQFLQADAKAIGNPSIRPGCNVQISGLGKYSGNYYVTETRHIFSERYYTTEFSVRGLRGNDLLTQMMPSQQLKAGQTLLIGIVTNNQDPDELGRVKVKLPTLSDNDESHWARVVTLGAGKNRGMDWFPEINDEVLVGFEHGDIHRPFIIGNVWNGKDTTPETSGNRISSSGVQLRTLKTREGHILQFVEEKGSSPDSGIHLKTRDGHECYINDSKKCIELKTKGGHTITLDDSGQKITMKSTSGHTVELSDSGASVKIKSMGSVSIEAMTTMDLKANGPLTVKGLPIQLN